MSMKCLLAAVAACSALSACAYIGEHTAPKKQATTTRSAAAGHADELFWNTLHGGNYAQIPAALEAQTAAYLQDPGDAVTAAHVGWLHIWRISERQRLASTAASITDDATLSRQYFEQAVALDPTDARFLGFLASATLAEGSIHHDERETRHGYFMLLDAINAWPQFNLFTAGYVMSSQPAGSERFAQALEWQWRTLDACVGGKVDRKTADYAPYMKLTTDQGMTRVCWNSWIAPHNFEGFFLNMGDMQVKAGDWQLARRLYANAKLSPTYSTWSYRQILEDRIRQAQQNVAAFNAPLDAATSNAMMGSSSFACVACHQGT